MSGLSPADFNALAALIKAAHDTTGGKKRIEVHCWSVAFKTAKGVVYRQHTNTPTGSLTSFDNYWPTRLSSTNGAENADGAFDPGHPKALEYLVNTHMDLVNFQTTAGPDGTDGHIDGIHYDYVRFEANTEGYNPTSVARYNARYGLSGDPASTSEQFKQWRRDQVTAFVRQMYARIQKTKPWVRQSGSFVTWNPSPTTSTRAGFQATRPYYDVYSDWDSWIQEGIVDIAVPMTYYDWAGSYPADFTRWMNFEKDRHGSRHMVIGPGIYMNYLSDAILELQMTRDPSPSGNYADGFCGYSYASPYSVSKGPAVYGTWANFAPELVSNVTPTWDDIPTMPWKVSPTTGHIMGTVTIAGTGAWADGAAVNITGPVSRTQTNDGTGFYAFIDLPPGSYTVIASKTDYPSATGTVAVAVGEVTGNMYEQNLVLGGDTPPSIMTQPQSQIVNQGVDATFTVSASGTTPLYYQWRFNTTNIAGATATSYTVASAQTSNAGDYSVVVTNAAGSVTSSNATLIVETNLSLTATATPGGAVYKNPDQSVYAPNSVVALIAAPVLGWTFSGWSGGASGTANPLTVMLTANLAITANFTSTVPDLIVDNLQTATTGTWTTRTAGTGYYASNFQTASTASSVTATAAFTPTIATAGNYDVYVWYPTPSSGTTSANAPFLVSYNGGTTNVAVNQQTSQQTWRLIASGVNFAAGTGGSVQLANNTGESSRRVLADAVRWVYSANQGSPPVIIAQPQDQNADQGTNVTFTVTATGTPAPSYQWRFNGTNLAYATASAYTCYNAQAQHAGSYSVMVSNIAGTLVSTDAVLTVIQPQPPTIDWIGLTTEGYIQLHGSGAPGHYSIEAATNLADWTELTNFTTTGATFQYTDGETNLPQRFYRARRLL